MICYDLFFCSFKNVILFFKRQELLQNAKDRCHNVCGKRKAAKYYIVNKEVLRENTKNKYRKLYKEEKEAKREYEKNRYRNMTGGGKKLLKEYQKNDEVAKSKISIFLCSIKVSENTLKVGNIKVQLLPKKQLL